MAHTTVQPTVSFPVMATIGQFFAAIGRGLVHMGETSSRYRRSEFLQALSDEDLAKRGIKREDIVRIVFSDSFWV